MWMATEFLGEAADAQFQPTVRLDSASGRSSKRDWSHKGLLGIVQGGFSKWRECPRGFWPSVCEAKGA